MMLNFLTRGYLSGYRTQIIAGLGLAGAIAGYWTGDLTAGQALGAAGAALGLDALRSGMPDKKQS